MTSTWWWTWVGAQWCPAACPPGVPYSSHSMISTQDRWGQHGEISEARQTLHNEGSFVKAFNVDPGHVYRQGIQSRQKEPSLPYVMLYRELKSMFWIPFPEYRCHYLTWLRVTWPPSWRSSAAPPSCPWSSSWSSSSSVGTGDPETMTIFPTAR